MTSATVPLGSESTTGGEVVLEVEDLAPDPQKGVVDLLMAADHDDLEAGGPARRGQGGEGMVAAGDDDAVEPADDPVDPGLLEEGPIGAVATPVGGAHWHENGTSKATRATRRRWAETTARSPARWLPARATARRAARAFLPEQAFLEGRQVSEVADRRPENDLSLVDTTTSDIEIGQRPRWRFAELLYAGAFDQDLASAGYEALFEDGLDLYLGSPGSDDSVLDRGSALVSGMRPKIQPEVLERIALLHGDDDRATFSTTLWRPAPFDDPIGSVEGWDLRRSVVDNSDHTRMVLQFVRSDWSKPIPRGRLPLHDLPSVMAEEPVAAPAAAPTL